MDDRIPIRIAARSTELARRHAGWVAERLAELGWASVLVEVATMHDASAPGTWRGAGVIVTSAQAAVRDGRADLAVRQFDELPATPADGLEVAAVPTRSAAHDVLLVRPAAFDPAAGPLPTLRGARIDARSPHRTSQLRALRPDLRFAPVGGALVPRIAALRGGGADGLLVAAVVLERLAPDLSGVQRVDLDTATMLPAPGQGALALEIRRGDPLGEVLTELHDGRGFTAIAAERTLLGLLAPVRQPALAAYALRTPAGQVALEAWLDGARARVRAGSADDDAGLAFRELTRSAR